MSKETAALLAHEIRTMKIINTFHSQCQQSVGGCKGVISLIEGNRKIKAFMVNALLRYCRDALIPDINLASKQ